MVDFEKVILKDQSQPVILAVLAHPDDETFGTGGTLALYARRGVQVYLVCATQGEVGEMDPELLKGFESVADRRVSELRCAAETLGLSEVFFLGYRDSGMPGSADNMHPQALAAAPIDQVAAQVAHYIRKLRPQVVITFDPIGGYRHPDHIAIQQATVKAFDLAGDPEAGPDPDSLPPYCPQKMYFSTFPRTFLRIGIFLMRLAGKDPHRFGVNGDIDMASIAEVSFPINARIDYSPVAAIRDEAAACHASQGGGRFGGSLINWVMRRARSQDGYMRARPEPGKGEKVEKDLFESL